MLDPFEAHIFHNALTDKQADWLIELMNKKGGVRRNELASYELEIFALHTIPCMSKSFD